MDLRRRQPSLRKELCISVLIFLFVSSLAVSPKKAVDPCANGIWSNCENGTRMANVNDCNSYYECGSIVGVARRLLFSWTLKNCGRNEQYDYLREICVNKSDYTQTCHPNCSGKHSTFTRFKYFVQMRSPDFRSSELSVKFSRCECVVFTRSLAMRRIKMRSMSNGVDVRLPILSLIVHSV